MKITMVIYNKWNTIKINSDIRMIMINVNESNNPI